MAWVATRSGDADTADIAESLNLCDDSIKFVLSSPRLGNEPRPPRPTSLTCARSCERKSHDAFAPHLSGWNHYPLALRLAGSRLLFPISRQARDRSARAHDRGRTPCRSF